MFSGLSMHSKKLSFENSKIKGIRLNPLNEAWAFGLNNMTENKPIKTIMIYPPLYMISINGIVILNWVNKLIKNSGSLAG